MELKKLYKKNDDGTIRTATVEAGSQGESEMKTFGFLETEPTETEQTETETTSSHTKPKTTAKSAKAE